MATPPAPGPGRDDDAVASFDAAARTQWMNVLAYHLLVTLVNLLNLPLQKGTYVPRRSRRLTVYVKRMEHLKLLKGDLDGAPPEAVRAYLTALKALVFELRVLLDQEPDLKPNPDFAPGLDRLETLLYDAQDVADFEELAHHAYRLSVLLPFYVDADALADRQAQAAVFEKSARHGK